MIIFIHGDSNEQNITGQLLAIISKQDNGKWQIEYQNYDGRELIVVKDYLSCAIAVENALIVLSNEGWDGLF